MVAGQDCLPACSLQSDLHLVYLQNPLSIQSPKNFKVLTRPPAILHSSYSNTKKDNPLALTKFFLVRTSGRVDSLDSAIVRC